MAEKTKSSNILEGEETKIKLKTADEVTFEVESSIANEMQTVKSFMDDVPDGANAHDDSIVIPLPNVTSRDLSRIIEYSLEHSRGTGNLKEFDEGFVAALDHDELKELLLAANYLNMKNLLNFLSSSIANIIKNKSVEFVRDFFGCVNDYTPEEESQLRHEHAWAFEGVDQD